MAMAEEGLNSRFSDMYKAFQYIDLDRSGRLSRDEISRALDLWNVVHQDGVGGNEQPLQRHVQSLPVRGHGPFCTLDKNEISRALDLWNIPIEDAKLNELILSCDRDGDGHVDYKEFVDALARDTAPAAMGKRGMQAKEAMGVESLDKAFLGHGNAPKHAMAMKQ